jgi:hypothetical protein
MHVFLTIIQTGHVNTTLKDAWSTLEQFYTPFYSNMTQDHILHILSLLISQTRFPRITTDRELDLSLMSWIMAMLNFNPSQHFAVDSYFTLLKQRHFKQYSLETKMRWYKDIQMAWHSGYTYAINIYWRTSKREHWRPLHVWSWNLTWELYGVGQKLYAVSSPL